MTTFLQSLIQHNSIPEVMTIESSPSHPILSHSLYILQVVLVPSPRRSLARTTSTSMSTNSGLPTVSVQNGQSLPTLEHAKYQDAWGLELLHSTRRGAEISASPGSWLAPPRPLPRYRGT
ncbi:hypothetical protein CEP54_003462 [Fusarium duplospermum]|uniref:Uncharacterized protein n=1 Tax=Fusarium duplospermum TaxID=1325734 RepID=A0A428QNX5_9HYPO|nr:hypothetical protein CEP54_003462 [Fusarium duplospermum]